jgi:1,6-anhydro-N-acetylmuramate kinase
MSSLLAFVQILGPLAGGPRIYHISLWWTILSGASVEKGLDRPIAAIGLMSGTSLDGIDAALITTDGVAIQSTGASLRVAYDAGLRGRLCEILGSRDRNGQIVSILSRRLAAPAQPVEDAGWDGDALEAQAFA